MRKTALLEYRLGEEVRTALAEQTDRSAWLGRLPHTRTEVETIASLFEQDATRAHFDRDATEENVKIGNALEQFDYVHFATHGLFNPRRPGFSSIILAQLPGSKEDGFLEMNEVWNLPLAAELVVLSGCRTGLGKRMRGEGLIGLTRAFMYAGASSVLVSLWNVNDASTAALMVEFYRNMLKKGMSKVDALREAKLAMLRGELRLTDDGLQRDVAGIKPAMKASQPAGSDKSKDYTHPYYWAPFVLVGDWE